jgi:sugar phosphate isomerase/epimerase
MSIDVFTFLCSKKPFEEILDYLVAQCVQAVEIGTGAYPGNHYCDPAALLASEQKLKTFKDAIEKRKLIISALSCHGNPLHPNKAVAKDHHDTFMQSVELAKKLGVESVITSIGCPS